MTETLYIIETLNRTIDTLTRANRLEDVQRVASILDDYLDKLVFKTSTDRSE